MAAAVLRAAARLRAVAALLGLVIAGPTASAKADTFRPASPSVTAGSGAAPRPQSDAVPLTAAVFAGIDPTGSVASDAGLGAFVAACLSGRGHDCFLPPGRYRLEQDLVIDFARNRDGGLHLHGSGQNASLITFAPGKALKIIDSDGQGAFYGTFDNFGVVADVADGPAVQLGRGDFADALNGFSFRDMFVKNTAGTRGSQGLLLNQVYASVFSNVTTSAGCRDDQGHCPDGGDSLLLRQAAFNTLQGSFSDARVGVRLADGYNFGNVFTALDEEVNFIDLAIENPQSRFNTFVGGQWHWFQGQGHSHAVMAMAGESNVLDNLNFSSPSPIGEAVGLNVRGGAQLVQTPAFPAPGALTTNTTGRSISVQIYGLTSRWRVCYGHMAATCIDQEGGGGIVSLPFRPGDAIRLEYGGRAGAWVWMELS